MDECAHDNPFLQNSWPTVGRLSKPDFSRNRIVNSSQEIWLLAFEFLGNCMRRGK
jgi:hypothetical protein